MARIFSVLFILVVFSSCVSDEKETIDVSGIQVDFKVNRFERKFYHSSIQELETLKKEYPFMFPSQLHDSVLLAKKQNEEELYLLEDADSIFGDFKETENELKDLFKHIKYYSPKFKPPTVITHISDLDYEYPVIYADSLLFIALDMYLGKKNVVYKDFPQYLANNYEKEHVVVDVAEDIILQSFPTYKSRVFLEYMVNQGRYMYLYDLFLPSKPDAIKFGVTTEKMAWAEANEARIWRYFLEKELLYDNDGDLITRFIDLAPFSKFYQESDQDSPGRIGVWIGWQIVRSYMQNNNVTLQQLMTTDAQEIFKKSKYKPRKQ